MLKHHDAGAEMVPQEGVHEVDNVGARLGRTDAWRKVTGQEQYMEDVPLVSQLWGKILRSPHPHARIRGIDVSRAESLPGVKAVITFRDIVPFKIGYSTHGDQFALCHDRARYVGDEVAAVAAVDEETAEKALSLIDVDYEVLPFVLDPIEAMKPDAIVLHKDKGTNIAAENHTEFGDVEKGFAEADHVFEDEFETQRQCHVCMEVHGCVANWGNDDSLSVWTSTQSPHIVKRFLAKAVDLPLSKVRVNRVGVGGAFGSRTDLFPHDVIAAYLSKKARRPVKLLFSRQEEFYASATRHPALVRIKTGIKDGMITTRHVTAILNGGAYTSQTGAVMGSLGWKASNYYRIENYRYDGYGVLTNTSVATAYRGYGGPQLGFALESQIDMIAERLELDPVEFRLNNANRQGDTSVSGSYFSSCELTQCIEAADRALEGEKPAGRDQGRGMAIGFGESGWRGAYYNNSDVSAATIKMNMDGSIHTTVGGAEIGTGYDTTMAQIAADALGVPIDQVSVHSGDTNDAAYDLGLYASRGAITSGMAVKLAADKTKGKLLDAAAKMLDTPRSELSIENRCIVSSANPNIAITMAEIAEHIYEEEGSAVFGTGIYDPQTHLADETGFHASPGGSITYPFCAVNLDVSVNRDTGEFKIGKIAVAVDCGKPINPAIVEGQIEGDVFHGLGMATVEPGLDYDDAGAPKYHHLVDYKLLTAADMPQIECIVAESTDPTGPFGVKGVTQLITSSVGAALANALNDAIGVRMTSLPITPEKILQALERAQS